MAAVAFVLVAVMLAAMGSWGQSSQAAVARIVLFTVYSAAIAFVLYRAGSREESVRSSHRLLLDRLPIGAALVDEVGMVRYANQAFGDTIGRTAGELEATPIMSIFQADDREAMRARIVKSAAGVSAAIRVRLLTTNGAEVPVFVSAMALTTGTRGAVTALIVHDEGRLLRAREEAEQQRGFSSFMIDAVAHDLANALTAAVGRAQLAHAAVAHTDGVAARSAGAAVEAAEHAAELVTDLRLLGQGEGPDARRVIVSIGRVVERAVAGARMREASTALVCAAASTLEARVWVTPLAHLALQKVIEEAASYLQARPQAVVVSAEPARYSHAGSTVTIRVRGGRSPLPETDLLASMRASAPGGGDAVPRHGVKLALASSIARANGWYIGLGSGEQPEGATEFVLEVPLGQPGVEGEAGPLVRIGSERAPARRRGSLR